jgi:hypothetical protein
VFLRKIANVVGTGTEAKMHGDVVHSQELLGLDFDVAYLRVDKIIDSSLGRPCAFGGDKPSERTPTDWLKAVVFHKYDVNAVTLCIGETIQLYNCDFGYVTTSSGSVHEQLVHGVLVQETSFSADHSTVNERQFVIESPLPVHEAHTLVDGGWSVLEGDHFRLRHIATDTYLGIKRAPRREANKNTCGSTDYMKVGLCKSDEDSMRETIFRFKLAKVRDDASDGTRQTDLSTIKHMSEVVLQVMCDPVLHVCHLLDVVRHLLRKTADDSGDGNVDATELAAFRKKLDEDESGHVTAVEFHDALGSISLKQNASLSESDRALLTQVVGSNGVIENQMLVSLLQKVKSVDEERKLRAALKHVQVECPASVQTDNMI